MSKGFLVPTRNGVVIKLRVSPGAKCSSIEGAYGEDALRLRVAAPPVDGKANAEAEQFLTRMLGVPRSEVAVVRSVFGQDKALLVRGTAVGELREALSDHLP